MARNEGTYTWRFSTAMVPLGVRGAMRSDAAMKAARTKATVVKKPKVVCTRLRELYMAPDRLSLLRELRRLGVQEVDFSGRCASYCTRRQFRCVGPLVGGLIGLYAQATDCLCGAGRLLTVVAMLVWRLGHVRRALDRWLRAL